MGCATREPKGFAHYEITRPANCSAFARQQTLNAIAKIAAHIQARAILKNYGVIAVKQGLQFFDMIEVYQNGAANPQESSRRELIFQPRQSRADIVRLAAGVKANIIAIRLDPFESFWPDKDYP